MRKSNSYTQHLVLQPLDPLFVPQDNLYNQQWHFSLIGSIGRPRAGGSRAGIEVDDVGFDLCYQDWGEGAMGCHAAAIPVGRL